MTSRSTKPNKNRIHPPPLPKRHDTQLRPPPLATIPGIDFEEAEKLRARIRELEHDLGSALLTIMVMSREALSLPDMDAIFKQQRTPKQMRIELRAAFVTLVERFPSRRFAHALAPIFAKLGGRS